MHRVLEFLSAYYPRYVCPPCLAELMTEQEPTVRAALTPTAGLEFATASCMNCRTSTQAVRFKHCSVVCVACEKVVISAIENWMRINERLYHSRCWDRIHARVGLADA
jgi:hypothetical protein